jgi:multimeric flavodoxin WrbA
MSKKIMILTASPNKKGNTALLAEWFCQGAKSKGAVCEIINVAGIKYKSNGCTACMKCQGSDTYACVIKDEASAVIAAVPEADVLVFATPIYFFGPSAQLKLILDRMYALFKFNRKTGAITSVFQGKSLVLLASSGGSLKSGLKLVEETFKVIAHFAGCLFDALLVPCAGKSGALVSNELIRSKAIALGRKVAAP